MKKSLLSLAAASLLLLSSCAAPASSTPVSSSAAALSNQAESEAVSSQAESQAATGGTITKSFGSYNIPANWFESEELSQPNLYFYLREGTTLDVPTSNITVNQGENKYAADEYSDFAKAIDAQLKSQAAQDGGVTNYQGSGSYTEKGYPLITMVIETEDIISTQYYIVGDYQFVMVFSSDFHDKNIPDVEQAALEIVNSFEWAA